MQRRLLLPILAAACLASLGVVLPRAGGGLSALPLPPGDVARAGGKGALVPAADWFEQIFRGLSRDDRRREDRGNREREDWDRGSDRSFRSFDDEEQESRRSAGGYFRTMCVRLCDGFPIPMSFSTTRSQFAKDARRCAQACPGGRLFVYRNPGGDMGDMVDLEAGLPSAAHRVFAPKQLCGKLHLPGQSLGSSGHRAAQGLCGAKPTAGRSRGRTQAEAADAVGSPRGESGALGAKPQRSGRRTPLSAKHGRGRSAPRPMRPKRRLSAASHVARCAG